MAKNKRALKERSKLYHQYYKRTGGYSFLGQNMIKLLVVLGVFGALLYVLSTYVLDVETLMCDWFTRFPPWMVIATLFASECFLGLLPPDAYILWGKTFAHPYFIVLILAAVSYLGGLISYGYGTLLYKIPQVNFWIEEKFAIQFSQIRRFGGLLVFLAAMAPLPFSPVSMVAGMVRFPFRLFWTIALARFLRFFLYAMILYAFLPGFQPC
ncbi:MAG: hypothetical protein JJU02_01440 [Cryomorphaceae bacterium]|nr:hypothetical protein [Cryomorphaceae bacterium]